MPPNLLVKACYVRENEHEYKGWVRTEFIIQSIYSYCLRDTFDLDTLKSMKEKEDIVLKHFIEFVNCCQIKYEKKMEKMIENVKLSTDIDKTIGKLIYSVGYTLFEEGITWSRIIIFFVFVGVLTKHLSKNTSEEVVDIIFERFSKYVKEKLESWVFDHGGWEDITNFDLVLNKKWYTKIINYFKKIFTLFPSR